MTYIGTSVKVNKDLDGGFSRTGAYERVLNDLGLFNIREFESPGGGLPDLSQAHFQYALNRGAKLLALSHKDFPSYTALVEGMRSAAAILREYGAKATWTYFHEPEDNHTPQGSRPLETWRVETIVIGNACFDAGANDVISTGPILMSWTLNPQSNRNWHNYLTDEVVDAIDFVGWDAYAGPGSATKPDRQPEDILGECALISKQVGKPWGIFETGARVDSTTTDEFHAAWYQSCIDFARDPRDYRMPVDADPALCYFLWHAGFAGQPQYLIDGSGGEPRLPLTIDVFREAGAYVEPVTDPCATLRADLAYVTAQRDTALALLVVAEGKIAQAAAALA